MKNKPLIITLIVILSIIAILLTAYLVFALTTGNTFFYNNYFGIGKTKNVIFDNVYQAKDIVNLEVISSAGDVNILESTDDNIRVMAYGRNSNDIEVSTNNGNLKVNFSEKVHFINFGFDIKDIVIYVPKNYSNNMKIDINYGDLKIDNFENATVDIKQDCGDIDIQTIKNATIKSSYGNIKANTILNKCNIDLSCGDVKIQNLEINENSLIKNDLGDIKIENTNDIFIDAKVDLGDIKIDRNNRTAETVLQVENSCGDIKINKQ